METTIVGYLGIVGYILGYCPLKRVLLKRGKVGTKSVVVALQGSHHVSEVADEPGV